MSFADALTFTLEQEGGWYDGSGSHDPNPTMKGVTQRTYDKWRAGQSLPPQSVRLVSDEELESIYRQYWSAVDGDRLPPKVGAAVFDMAVNAGPLTALRLLQRAVGVHDDGVLGPATRAALAAREDSVVAHRFGVERLKFYLSISRKNPKLRPALVGWVSRVTQFSDRFLTA